MQFLAQQLRFAKLDVRPRGFVHVPVPDGSIGNLNWKAISATVWLVDMHSEERAGNRLLVALRKHGPAVQKHCEQDEGIPPPRRNLS